ncbi:HlyD family secretion protein [Photobacterium lutimaris]|uniref:HlyD family secretion protein n=1 Tax=Photobacterium lutimaris TaxID=388278 RepID=UPI0010E3DECE|nr:HlyD family efflux transporter periplasmic adaptor subunit [Photobacterium lutimaris]TDR76018.1 membrane fusion protein [Photobacterium lutimaris]
MFRKEAIQAQRNRLLGQVVVYQPVSIYIACATIFVIFLLLIIYISQSHYSRKETVKGYLIPKKGVVKVYSNRTGVIENLFVGEGDQVNQGEAIAKIQNSQSLSTGVELSIALSKELLIQIQVLEQELTVIEQMYNKDLSRIERQLEQQRKSLSAIQKAKATSTKKLSLKEKQFKNNQKLYEKGFLSFNQLSIIQEKYFDVLESHDRLEKELASIHVDISISESEWLSLPEKKKLKQIAIKRQISELNAQRIELNNQYEFIKKAPESGIVTAIQPTIGTRISIDTPLLSIIPTNSPLEIELLLPTKSAGFVQLGDKVNIRFDAFPYQKFGFITGKVSSIDKALILPTDKVLPIKVDEAMYRVRVKLEKQYISAYGKKFPLKVGMIADADIILEKRSLLEWLLDPIYAVKGKLG